MTKREAIRQTVQEDTLRALGFTREEAEALRRISMTLHRWAEKECGDGNGCIERDEETGKTFWLNSFSGRRYPIADKETGARKRLEAIIARRNARITNDSSKEAEQNIHATCAAKLAGEVSAYIQGDPRGAALYILRPGDVPEGKSADGYYNRGICVY